VCFDLAPHVGALVKWPWLRWALAGLGRFPASKNAKRTRKSADLLCPAFLFSISCTSHAERMHKKLLEGLCDVFIGGDVDLLKRSVAGTMSHKRSGKMVCRMFPVCQAHASSSSHPFYDHFDHTPLPLLTSSMMYGLPTLPGPLCRKRCFRSPPLQALLYVLGLIMNHE
jgi:hypothetical protein